MTPSRPDRGVRRAVMFGAGATGTHLVAACGADRSLVVVAALDDDPRLWGTDVGGVEVVGGRDRLDDVASRNEAEVVVLAVAGAGARMIGEILGLARSCGLELMVVPAPSELAGPVSVTDLRRPTVEDLFARDPVVVDGAAVARLVTDRRVMITGAGGSVGSALARLTHRFGPSHLFLLDWDERAFDRVRGAVGAHRSGVAVVPVLADVRHRLRVFEAFDQNRSDVVVHAAAMTSVPLVGANAAEAVKTNTVGTRNVLDAALASGVDRVVNLSSHLAADPTSALGATQRAAERLTTAAAEVSGRPYVSVRFSNVMGTAGSVLANFLYQAERGLPLTVTDPDATRRMATAAEVAHLVLGAALAGRGGDVVSLEVGHTMKIIDLAQHVLSVHRSGALIEVTGLRPVERPAGAAALARPEVGVAGHHPRIFHLPGETVDPYPDLAAATGLHPADLRSQLDRG